MGSFRSLWIDRPMAVRIMRLVTAEARPGSMPFQATARSLGNALPDGIPPSDGRAIPSGKSYCLALRFNAKRRGIAAFSWVAVWRGLRGTESVAFPLDAYGFAEALRGAATTILMETGLAVPDAELDIASYKERRVNEYLRTVALQEADAIVARNGGWG